MNEFDRDSAVTPRPGEPGVYDADLADGWRIGKALNGGFLLALGARALISEFEPLGHPDPFSVSGYYLSATVAGPATVSTEVLRRGKAISTGTAVIRQLNELGEPVERLRLLAAMGDVTALGDDVRTTARPPELPPVEQCIGREYTPDELREHFPFMDRIDLRLDPACVGWALGEPSVRGLVQGWIRLPDERPPDVVAALLAVDALPPVSFDLGVAGWSRTVELTAHVRARPVDGWLRVVHSTRNYAGGLMEEDAEVWDAADRLVVQSRQLAVVG